MSMPWLKLHCDFFFSPKVQSMSAAMQQRLVMLHCLKGIGGLETSSEEQIRLSLRLSKKQWANTKELFIENGFIDEYINLLGWGKSFIEGSQYTESDDGWEASAEGRKESREPLSAAERMRLYRERKRIQEGAPVTPVTQPVTPVTQSVTPVTQPVTPVTQPVTPVTKPVTKPVTEPVTRPKNDQQKHEENQQLTKRYVTPLDIDIDIELDRELEEEKIKSLPAPRMGGWDTRTHTHTHTHTHAREISQAEAQATHSQIAKPESESPQAAISKPSDNPPAQSASRELDCKPQTQSAQSANPTEASQPASSAVPAEPLLPTAGAAGSEEPVFKFASYSAPGKEILPIVRKMPMNIYMDEIGKFQKFWYADERKGTKKTERQWDDELLKWMFNAIEKDKAERARARAAYEEKAALASTPAASQNASSPVEPSNLQNTAGQDVPAGIVSGEAATGLDAQNNRLAEPLENTKQPATAIETPKGTVWQENAAASETPAPLTSPLLNQPQDAPEGSGLTPALPVARPPSSQPAPQAKPKPAKHNQEGTPLQRLCRETWAQYSAAYQQRYGTAPLRNGKTNAQVKQLCQRLGQNAPQVAAYYLKLADNWYIRNYHEIGLLLNKCEGIYTAYKTNQNMTSVKARQIENTQANISAANYAENVLSGKVIDPVLALLLPGKFGKNRTNAPAVIEQEPAACYPNLYGTQIIEGAIQ